MILFFNNGWYLPMSGGDLHVLEMARSWARSRDVGIAMPRWAYRLNTKRLTGVRHVATGGPFDGSPPGSLASLFARYAVRSVSGLGADAEVVVAASHYPYDLIPAFLVARRRRRPLVVYVFHLASMFRGAGRRGRLVGLWEALALRLMRRASLVFVDNQEVGEELATRGLARSAIHLTWNGVTPPQTAPAGARRSDEVVFCGRISETKGWRDLVAVAERLRDDCPGTRLRVLGEGDGRRQLEQLVVSHGLEDTMSIEGFVADEVKWEALARAAAFVSPSREEGWGIAVSEALEAGTEVVCFDLPVYREVHPSERLHLVPTGDVAAFAQTLVEVLRGEAPPRNATAPDGADARRPRTWEQIAASELLIMGAVMPGRP